jgi:hypothetical protein
MLFVEGIGLARGRYLLDILAGIIIERAPVNINYVYKYFHTAL